VGVLTALLERDVSSRRPVLRNLHAGFSGQRCVKSKAVNNRELTVRATTFDPDSRPRLEPQRADVCSKPYRG
jgi:hypothetical protein